MKISNAFPSKYLKADVDVPDFEDGGIVVTVSHVEMADVGTPDEPDSKPVVYFEETAKGLVLNRTNASTLTTLFGTDDTDHWVGKRIKLYAKDVEFSGKMTRGIRVHSRPVPGPAKPANVKAAKPLPADDKGDNDDIPF